MTGVAFEPRRRDYLDSSLRKEGQIFSEREREIEREINLLCK